MFFIWKLNKIWLNCNGKQTKIHFDVLLIINSWEVHKKRNEMEHLTEIFQLQMVQDPFSL